MLWKPKEQKTALTEAKKRAFLTAQRVLWEVRSGVFPARYDTNIVSFRTEHKLLGSWVQEIFSTRNYRGHWKERKYNLVVTKE